MTTNQISATTVLHNLAVLCGVTTMSVGPTIHEAYLAAATPECNPQRAELRLDAYEAVSVKYGVSIDSVIRAVSA